MSSINEDSARIYEAGVHALAEDLLEYPLEQIRTFEASLVILPECAEVRYGVMKAEAQKPAVCHIDFYLFDRLTHTLYAEHVLYDRYFDHSHRIDAWPTIIRRIFFFNKIVYE